MSYIKSQSEIEKILEGGRLMGEILEKLEKMVAVGGNAKEIDTAAEKMIREVGGIPAFKGYKPSRHATPFPSTICASLNTEIVHGIATEDKVFKEGDIFSIDIGMQWPAKCGEGQDGNGFFTDTAITVPVGKIDEKTRQLMNVTKKSMYLGIEQVRVGNSIADIGKKIQHYIDPQGYGIIRDLVGHGVGHKLHEDPRVPNYYDKELEMWEIRPGVVIAIEPMITLGDYDITTGEDGWGIFTADGSLSAHFEHTIVVTENGPIVATKRPSEKLPVEIDNSIGI
ncbi:MAG: type I methionyl aminopeptidase [Candidatus Magasanikbacteria bacterium CG11_big_fil_rev_8_21_14_0_20_39_34]|uniref:Methionine aminopeptidase n=1 Tax=Candidatus Magasanikbacteria bacterium CG11_big_fil_rev_8_21_14_0_20_39_34 TaxID=1974653 RepID=A0A2H0N3U7_9BACT|nr:MAG: type I methionyl aminopeptidase [Candidatus Magasanikbacteria bacterium CG11_big_fil_rev_8_21_14_0_20_39_34]